MAMSRIKQLVSPTKSDERNSSADEKDRHAKPNSLIRSGTDSRIDSSSSTTDRSGGPFPLLSLTDSISKIVRHLVKGVHCTLVLPLFSIASDLRHCSRYESMGDTMVQLRDALCSGSMATASK